MPKVGSSRSWPSSPVAKARPNECETVSDTTSRLGRPNITSPNPSAPSVRNTPTTPAARRNTVSIALGAAGRACERRLEHRGRAEGPHLAADLAAFVAHLAAEREHVARDDAARVQHDVALDGDEVAEQLAVHVRGALHHEQVAGHALVRADAEIAQPRGAAGDRHAHAAVAWPQRRAELRLDRGGLAEVVERDRAARRRAPGAIAWGAGCGSGRRPSAPGSSGHVGDQRPEPVHQLDGAGAGGVGAGSRRTRRAGQQDAPAPAPRGAG